MTRILLPAVASCLLVACVGLASAQAPERREGRSGGGGERAAPQRAPEAPRAAPVERSQGQRPAVRPERVQRGPVERQAAPEPRSRQRDPSADRNRAARQERPRQERGQQRNSQRDAERERERNRAASRSEERRNAERRRNEERAGQSDRNEQAAERERSQRTRAQSRQGDQPKANSQAADAQAAARGAELRRARERLAPEQRQRLRASFDFRRAKVNVAGIRPRVAYRVPRSVRLYAVPTQVVSLFPSYSEYRYVVIEDQVCIVDPVTYEIVDVIDQGYYAYAPSRALTAGLTLTADQIALLRDSIPRDFPDADGEVRLSAGARIPATTELYTFPEVVLDRIPKLRDYQFLVIGEHLVIAETRDRTVELVLDRF